MTTPPTTTTPPAPSAPPARSPLVRRTGGRVLTGVAGGVADHLGISPSAARLAFVLTSMVWGAGLVTYLFLYATMPKGAPAPAGTPGAFSNSAPGAGPGTGRRAPGGIGGGAPTRRPLRWGWSVLLVVAAAVLVVLSAPLTNIDLGTVLPIAAITFGAVFFWSQLDAADAGPARVRWVWLLAGLAFTCGGLIAMLAQDTERASLWRTAGAVVAALVGLIVLAAPWILRLSTSLRAEQAARIRATERADIAAHLHDSVLQTLALIQRQSADPAAVARLARAQERQLRSYLYDEQASIGTFATAVTDALHEVEDLHGVPVELVVTGDRPLDERTEALVKAVREATWNAVRHGRPPVTVYVEVGRNAVEAFVRDHGDGFELDEVAPDRAGVRESIIGRMDRAGGSARIRRRSDGTEIELQLPLPMAPPGEN